MKGTVYTPVAPTVFGIRELQSISGIPNYQIRDWCYDGTLAAEKQTERPKSRYRIKGVDLLNLLIETGWYPGAAKRLVRHLRLEEVPRHYLLAYALGDI